MLLPKRLYKLRKERNMTLQALYLQTGISMGALSAYVSNPAVENFQPMNVNFGIIEPLGYRVKGKQEKNLEIAKRALEEIDYMVENRLI